MSIARHWPCSSKARAGWIADGRRFEQIAVIVDRERRRVADSRIFGIALIVIVEAVAWTAEENDGAVRSAPLQVGEIVIALGDAVGQGRCRRTANPFQQLSTIPGSSLDSDPDASIQETMCHCEQSDLVEQLLQIGRDCFARNAHAVLSRAWERDDPGQISPRRLPWQCPPRRRR